MAIADASTLTVDEADGLVKSGRSRVIAIAGPQSAGKTSLIAGLYDLFQIGRVGRVAFAQSYSLHAFEQAAHDSRAASRREEPTTPRTERGEVRFYHLQLVDTETGEASSVLFGDRAGEEYLETKSNPMQASEYPELKRADVLTLLVDGARMLDPGQRHNLRSEVRQTLQAFAEASVIRPTQRLALVLTKLDVIMAAKQRSERTLQDFETLVTRLRADYGARFAEVEAFRVAAQPRPGEVGRGEGLDSLLSYWMSEPVRCRATVDAIEIPVATRYFARLLPLTKGSL